MRNFNGNAQNVDKIVLTRRHGEADNFEMQRKTPFKVHRI